MCNINKYVTAFFIAHCAHLWLQMFKKKIFIANLLSIWSRILYNLCYQCFAFRATRVYNTRKQKAISMLISLSAKQPINTETAYICISTRVWYPRATIRYLFDPPNSRLVDSDSQILPERSRWMSDASDRYRYR